MLLRLQLNTLGSPHAVPVENATTAASAPIQTWLVFFLSSESIIITVFLPIPAFFPVCVSELGTSVTALVTAVFDKACVAVASMTLMTRVRAAMLSGRG